MKPYRPWVVSHFDVTPPAVNKADHIAGLQTTIQHWHNCAAVWRESVPVHEVFNR